MIICVYWFELFSQVSDVAHGPLVIIKVPFTLEFSVRIWNSHMRKLSKAIKFQKLTWRENMVFRLGHSQSPASSFYLKLKNARFSHENSNVSEFRPFKKREARDCESARAMERNFSLAVALSLPRPRTLEHRVFSSPELKAQMSFSDHLSSVVCLSVRLSVCLSVCLSDCLSVCLSVCKLFTFSSSPAPLGQFQANLAQRILGWRGFKLVQIKGPALFQREIIMK